MPDDHGHLDELAVVVALRERRPRGVAEAAALCSSSTARINVASNGAQAGSVRGVGDPEPFHLCGRDAGAAGNAHVLGPLVVGPGQCHAVRRMRSSRSRSGSSPTRSLPSNGSQAEQPGVADEGVEQVAGGLHGCATRASSSLAHSSRSSGDSGGMRGRSAWRSVASSVAFWS